MRSDSIRTICAEMNGRIDYSTPLGRKMLGSMPLPLWLYKIVKIIERKWLYNLICCPLPNVGLESRPRMVVIQLKISELDLRKQTIGICCERIFTPQRAEDREIL